LLAVTTFIVRVISVVAVVLIYERTYEGKLTAEESNGARSNPRGCKSFWTSYSLSELLVQYQPLNSHFVNKVSNVL
jgi:hypothetical protein